jgi:plastocyanin
MRVKTGVIFAATLLILGGVACSSRGSSEGHPVSLKTASIDLKALAFAPSQVQIAVGGTVTWTDREPVEHTITSGKPDAPEATFDKVVLEGEMFTFTFAKAGAFPYFCRRHPTNMQGTVIVS